MLGISLGAPELLIIFGIVLLLFGAPRLPKLARSLGLASKEFKRGADEGMVDDEAGERSKSDEKPPGKRSGTGA